jgi:hypothetical protein
LFFSDKFSTRARSDLIASFCGGKSWRNARPSAIDLEFRQMVCRISPVAHTLHYQRIQRRVSTNARESNRGDAVVQMLLPMSTRVGGRWRRFKVQRSNPLLTDRPKNSDVHFFAGDA